MALEWMLDEERQRIDARRKERLRHQWYQECVRLYDRYKEDFPSAKVVNEWGPQGTSIPIHIKLPNGMRIPFPPLPEELKR